MYRSYTASNIKQMQIGFYLNVINNSDKKKKKTNEVKSKHERERTWS